MKQKILRQLSSKFAADEGSDTCTIPMGTPSLSVASESGRPVRFTSTGTLPGGISLNTDYYLYFVSNIQFKVCTSLENVESGVYVNITNAGTGVHTVSTVAVGNKIFDYLGESDRTYTYQDKDGTVAMLDDIPPAGGLPVGVILMWSGAIVDIPIGFALCDGQNGTPDLRDRFIVGAGNAYPMNSIGGEAVHTLTIAEMPVHTHVQNAHNHTQNAHNHTQAVNSTTTGGQSGYTPDTSTNSSVTSGYTTGATTATNNPATAVNQDAGGGGGHENRPPFWALAFIIKT